MKTNIQKYEKQTKKFNIPHPMKNYHHLPAKHVLSLLHSNTKGLTQRNAINNLKKYGPNKLPEKKKFSVLSLFLGQFKNPLIYILIVAFIISFSTDHKTDAWIILAVIMISAGVGFLQEYKANASLAKLQQLIKYKAKVIREGRESIIKQEELVPGDIILLAPGDKVPADARLIEAENLEVIEAALTGESLPIEKNIKTLPRETAMADRRNMVFQGTVIARGNAKAIITATGLYTQIGQIASLLSETKEGTTPLQKQILHFGKVIGIALVVINILIFGLGILTGKPLFDMFMVSVAMIVAAVPEGLLPAMTVILAIGMQNLAKHKGLVKKMLATETLGSVTVICSDKTGTLTQGEMRVSEIITESEKISDIKNSILKTIGPDGDASHITALKVGLMCNDAIIENPEDELHTWRIIGNPTDKALLLAGRATGIEKESLEKEFPRIGQIPFESESKFMVTIHKGDDGTILRYMKGAPEQILSFSSFIDIEGEKVKMNDEKRKLIQKQQDDLTKTGLRVIAVAYKSEKNTNRHSTADLTNPKGLKDYVFVGLIALNDPLRPEAKESMKLCKKAGIRPVIITGDHKLTTLAILKELGIKASNENVMEGKELEKISDEKLKKIINKITVFARVEPKHKIRIIAALQENREMVAMIGDGVNDAPALKKADIGVAVGSGTDVAKETASLILLDDNFKTMVEAVRRGRGIFDNIRKVVLYLLSNSFTEVVLIGISIILGLPLALLPVQILWIKMIEDSLPSMALSFDPVGHDVMSRSPKGFKEVIFNNKMKKLVVLFIVISDTLLFAIFYWFLKTSGDIAYAQTIAFVGLGIASRFYIFSIRGIDQSIFSFNPFENKLVNLSTIFGFLMIIIAVYVPFLNRILYTVPLGVKEWVILIAYGLITVVIYEIGKKIFIIEKGQKRK